MISRADPVLILMDGGSAGAAPPPSLGRGMVHVWVAEIPALAGRSAEFAGLLSYSERAKARGFRLADLSVRYVLRHGLLRSLLADYTGEPAGGVIRAGLNGKPVLDLSPISFSLSSSADLAVISLARDVPLGIDIARIDPHCRPEEIAAFLFSPRERRCLDRAGGDGKVARFFTMWAMKEAIVKASGEGVGGLRHADLACLSADPPGPWYRYHDQRAGSLLVRPFIPRPGYRGAVAVGVSHTPQGSVSPASAPHSS